MEFCKECGNVLLPRKNKSVLYCRVCDKEYPISKKEKRKLAEYKRAKRSRTVRKKTKQKIIKTAIVEEVEKKPSISEDERAAFEELFELSESEY